MTDPHRFGREKACVPKGVESLNQTFIYESLVQTGRGSGRNANCFAFLPVPQALVDTERSEVGARRNTGVSRVGNT